MFLSRFFSPLCMNTIPQPSYLCHLLVLKYFYFTCPAGQEQKYARKWLQDNAWTSWSLLGLKDYCNKALALQRWIKGKISDKYK